MATVSVKLSPTGEHPGTLITGRPSALRKFLPRKSITPIEPVTLPTAAGTPPQVAQVPMAMTAAAPGASSRSHWAVGIGWGLPSELMLDPMADQ